MVVAMAKVVVTEDVRREADGDRPAPSASKPEPGRWAGEAWNGSVGFFDRTECR